MGLVCSAPDRETPNPSTVISLFYADADSGNVGKGIMTVPLNLHENGSRITFEVTCDFGNPIVAS